jgi:hypothetical protein
MVKVDVGHETGARPTAGIKKSVTQSIPNLNAENAWVNTGYTTLA